MGRVESSHDGGDPGSAVTTRHRPGLFQPECCSRAIFAQIHFTISQLHSQWEKKIIFRVVYPLANVTEAASRVPGRVSRSTGLLF